MFQAFEAPADPSIGAGRTRQLRALLSELKIDAFLVPRADEHQGEYVPKSAERLGWLTGFTGSAGSAVVARKHAALFVDGRYTVQSRAQVDTSVFEILQLPQHTPGDWLIAKLGTGATVGFDPWLHTIAGIERLAEQLAPRRITLKPVARNPIDRIWGRARPAVPAAPVRVQALARAGKSAEDKIAELQAKLKADEQDAVVLTLPDSIAWLFNIRGADIAHNPVVLAFAIVRVQGKAELFIAPAKLDKEVKAHLGAVARLFEPKDLQDRIGALRQAKCRVRLDPETAAWWLARRLGDAKRIRRGADPCILPKARKNAAEIAGARAAHLRDGAAMVRFLAWLDREAGEGGLDEITAVEELERCRVATGALREISFDTISGSGPNGAIVHYRVNAKTNRRLAHGELFLIDSGGQYADGTTDVTRTVAIGTPSAEMRERFTLVLKGHIAIATARFPMGTRGVDLDPFARRALWSRGLDFDHGTGHGVGSYLSVHEGPQSISRRGKAELHPGMIASNEPGYYKEGAYGIRIENLALVTEATAIKGGDRPMMGFETLTLVPIDRRLVDSSLLGDAETQWLNAYHARVLREIGPALGDADRAWLAQACAPVF